MESIGWEEYAVLGTVLFCSTAIGVYYGFFTGGQKSTSEYLLAGRNMSSIPLSLSLVCRFVPQLILTINLCFSMVSAITLLGYPVEIFLYGTQYMVVVFAFIPLILSLCYLYIPVYFQFGVCSAYEVNLLKKQNLIFVIFCGSTSRYVSMLNYGHWFQFL